MKICIDARPVSNHMHGISRYAFNLIEQLAHLGQRHQYLILTRMNSRMFLPPLPGNFEIQECHSQNYSITEQLVIPWLMRKESVDLFHATTYSAPILQTCKTVVTIHDLIPMIFPEHYRWIHAVFYRQVVRRALQKAGWILTVSLSSKDDLIRYFGLDRNKIVVTYNGVDDRFCLDASGLSKKIIEEAFALKDPFILSVVNDRPHKNVSVLVGAFETFLQKVTIPYKLVIVGIPEDISIGNSISRGVADSLIFLPRVTDDQLIALYQNATLFVLPTLYEGFCLPVLEAMACGTPVITSNVSSLPEVTGNAAILVNPNNIDELAEAIYNVLAREDLQKELREKGMRQAKQFSWQETARQTLKIYEQVTSFVG